MKQAFTNTIRGGGRNPLTIAAGSKKSKSKQQIPKCAYGAACTRKGCAYRHPSPSEALYESYHDDPGSKICKPFLAGLCTYAHKCMNRHPAQDEADAVIATYKEKSCSYGDDCQTEGCLYWHPWEAEALENAEYTGEICTAVGGLHLEGGGGAADGGVVPTYEQWLALNCPPPPTMDENYVYNIWHYPGSGLQRSPWEVYCLMYGQNFNSTMNGANLSAASQTWEPAAMNGANLSASSQTWEPAANNHIHAAPQSWEPANHINNEQEEDPKTFQEWKKKGQPYPSWFCSDLDPWYDDEGVRRSLEGVYEVLYGENAQEKFAQKQQVQQVATDPTPAELAVMISTNDTQLLGTSLVVQPAMGGWASIAAKRPVPVQKTTLATANGIGSTTGNQSTAAGGESSANSEQKRKMVVIPKEVWLPSTANSDCFHLFPNPIERFNAVNQHHKSYLASVTIPKCFEDAGSNTQNHRDKSKNGGKVTILDVHFQSGKTITPVLNRFLNTALKKNEEVWVVTGSGHHVAVGHQRREGGGVLFNSVKRYLEDREEEMTLEFRIGKDTSGGKNKTSGGAFLVRRVS